ncbi:MAG: phosphoribosyltransferase [Actinobacteria bacterium HGW-Actinobacteria-4]|nr:MAG: phosphoribosyltransferase [Actinobacteria bacterium HGW-Actinobacteria-4]
MESGPGEPEPTDRHARELTGPVADARRAVLKGFAWSEGHADVWSVFEDGPRFAAVIAGLAHLASRDSPTRIIGVEARGFLLGGAVAAHLGVGFRAVRKSDGLLAGAKVSAQSAPDYRGRSYDMRTHATLNVEDRIVMVDDWIELGSQATAVRGLVESQGAQWLGVVTMVDDRNEHTADAGPVQSLVLSRDLGPSAA